MAVATSWVSGADGSIFPLQNLPFGVFSHAATGRDPRVGVAIGAARGGRLGAAVG